MRLLIAVPSLDMMHAGFVRCLVELVQRLERDGHRVEVKILTGTLAHVARDRLAAHAIGSGFTHVLWLDTDMVFDDELVYDLQFAHKDFVSGIARSRRAPYCSCLFSNLKQIERIDDYPRDTFEVAGCGFACVLIKTEILAEVWKHFGTCFLPTAALGEDLAFCERATSLGYKIYGEPAARLGHIGNITIYPDDVEILNQIGRVTE
jgi:GT2 family glycosyltransferase